jgi:hypothetical protein
MHWNIELPEVFMEGGDYTTVYKVQITLLNRSPVWGPR